MKQTQIWIAVITDENEVIFRKACQNKQTAEKTIVRYLRKTRDFDGKDFDQACFWIGEKGLSLDLRVFSMQPEDFQEVWDQLAMFRTDLPLKDKGLYRVIYEIDVGATSALQAAKQVHQIMSDPQSLPPVLDIVDNRRNKIRIDLSQRKTKGRTHAK